MRAWKYRVPLALTVLRAMLAPVVVVLALWFPNHGAFALCLALAFVSDVFDGIIARRLGIATAGLRRLDSVADTVFYVAAVWAAWHLHAVLLRAHFGALGVLVALELARYAFDYAKFGREASYHMWSSKLWGVLLVVAFAAMLVFDAGGVALSVAVWWGIVADVEGMVISWMLREWRADVPTFVHAWRLRARGVRV